MTLKTTILAAFSLFLLAPAGCDESTEQSALALDVVRGLAPVEELELLEAEASAVPAAHGALGEFELMSPARSNAGQLCCGHGTHTWDCSGTGTTKGNTITHVQACESSPYCTVGACGTKSAEDVPLDLDPIDPIEIELPHDQH